MGNFAPKLTSNSSMILCSEKHDIVGDILILIQFVQELFPSIGIITCMRLQHCFSFSFFCRWPDVVRISHNKKYFCIESTKTFDTIQFEMVQCLTCV